MTQNAKIWDRDGIQELLKVNDKAVGSALLRIYARQTAAERDSQVTTEHNGRGFTAVDAPFLSSVASKMPRYNNQMTPRQLAKVRKIIPKYWSQLLEEVELRGGQVCRKQPVSAEPKSPPSETAREAVGSMDADQITNKSYGVWA